MPEEGAEADLEVFATPLMEVEKVVGLRREPGEAAPGQGSRDSGEDGARPILEYSDEGAVSEGKTGLGSQGRQLDSAPLRHRTGGVEPGCPQEVSTP